MYSASTVVAVRQMDIVVYHLHIVAQVLAEVLVVQLHSAPTVDAARLMDFVVRHHRIVAMVV